MGWGDIWGYFVSNKSAQQNFAMSSSEGTLLRDLFYRQCLIPDPPKIEKKLERSYEHKKEFLTKSFYTGETNIFGMDGYGIYSFPGGTVYEGNLFDGEFHGSGVLKLPSGYKVRGTWRHGDLVSHSGEFADGLRVSDIACYLTPERRRYHNDGDVVKTRYREFLTNAGTDRAIPNNRYDSGYGFYDPVKRSIEDSNNGAKIIATVADDTAKWIEENCRHNVDDGEVIGFRPDLFTNWFSKGNRTSK